MPVQRFDVGGARGGRRRPGRFPVFLSAFIYPGAGQFAQRRWGAGLLFSALFTLLFVWFLVAFGRIVLSLYRLAFNFGTAPAPDPSVRPAVLLFLLAFLVYLANVLDAHRAFRREAARWSRDRFRGPSPEAMRAP